MRHYSKAIAVAGLSALLYTSALAAGSLTIHSLPDNGQVTLTGTVDKVKNEKEFTLRDATGKIDVNLTTSQSVVLEKGAQVTVTGEVKKGLLGKDIDASQVAVSKESSDASGSTTTPQEATAYTIKNLPKEGAVKISGTVSDVDNEKEFTLKDATGKINVDIKSAQTAELKEGAQVTVIGYVDSGLTGKDINATEIQVVSDALPVAKTTN